MFAGVNRCYGTLVLRIAIGRSMEVAAVGRVFRGGCAYCYRIDSFSPLGGSRNEEKICYLSQILTTARETPVIESESYASRRPIPCQGRLEGPHAAVRGQGGLVLQAFPPQTITSRWRAALAAKSICTLEAHKRCLDREEPRGTS